MNDETALILEISKNPMTMVKTLDAKISLGTPRAF